MQFIFTLETSTADGFFTNVTSSNCQVKYEFEFHSNANVPENKGEFLEKLDQRDQRFDM